MSDPDTVPCDVSSGKRKSAVTRIIDKGGMKTLKQNARSKKDLSGNSIKQESPVHTAATSKVLRADILVLFLILLSRLMAYDYRYVAEVHTNTRIFARNQLSHILVHNCK